MSQQQQSSLVFAEIAEHIGPVGVDFLGGWSLPVFGEHSASGFERRAGWFLFERGREVAFQNFMRVTLGGNSMRVRLYLQGRPSFSGISINIADFLSIANCNDFRGTSCCTPRENDVPTLRPTEN